MADLDLFCLIINLVLPFSLGKEITGLENQIPFMSVLSPSFPRCVPRNNWETQRQFKKIQAYSMHCLTITFLKCSGQIQWHGGEKVIIEAGRDNNYPIYDFFDQTHTPYTGNKESCILKFLAKIPFNLDGFPLTVSYEINREKVVEQSYMIKYLVGDINIAFDKNVYENGEKIVIMCVISIPGNNFSTPIIMTPPDDAFVESFHRTLNNGFILEVTGFIFHTSRAKNFSCKVHSIEVFKIAHVRNPVVGENNDFELSYNIDRTGVAVCIIMFSILMIIFGIFVLIFGRKDRLSYDMSAYYTELIEDKTIRFSNPIINNLTSPLRKYKLPGILTAFQLRRNFTRLIDLLLQKYSKETLLRPMDKEALLKDEEAFMKKEDSLNEVEGGEDLIMDLPGGMEQHRILKPSYLSSNTGILPGTTAVSVGPLPQETPKYVEVIQLQTEEKVTESIFKKKSEEIGVINEDSSISTNTGGSDSSLDRHVISMLPYTRLTAVSEPHWMVQETEIPVKIGISPQTRVFMSKQTSL